MRRMPSLAAVVLLITPTACAHAPDAMPAAPDYTPIAGDLAPAKARYYADCIG